MHLFQRALIADCSRFRCATPAQNALSCGFGEWKTLTTPPRFRRHLESWRGRLVREACKIGGNCALFWLICDSEVFSSGVLLKTSKECAWKLFLSCQKNVIQTDRSIDQQAVYHEASLTGASDVGRCACSKVFDSWSRILTNIGFVLSRYGGRRIRRRCTQIHSHLLEAEVIPDEAVRTRDTSTRVHLVHTNRTHLSGQLRNMHVCQTCISLQPDRVSILRARSNGTQPNNLT